MRLRLLEAFTLHETAEIGVALAALRQSPVDPCLQVVTLVGADVVPTARLGRMVRESLYSLSPPLGDPPPHDRAPGDLQWTSTIVRIVQRSAGFTLILVRVACIIVDEVLAVTSSVRHESTGSTTDIDMDFILRNDWTITATGLLSIASREGDWPESLKDLPACLHRAFQVEQARMLEDAHAVVRKATAHALTLPGPIRGQGSPSESPSPLDQNQHPIYALAELGSLLHLLDPRELPEDTRPRIDSIEAAVDTALATATLTATYAMNERAERLLDAQSERDNRARDFEHGLAMFASLVLIPGLVFAAWGSNVWLPGANSTGGTALSLATAALSGTASYAVLKFHRSHRVSWSSCALSLLLSVVIVLVAIDLYVSDLLPSIDSVPQGVQKDQTGGS